MIVRLLFGVGMFTLGYVIGKAVGNAQATETSGHPAWKGDDDEAIMSHPRRPDADFAQARPREGGEGSEAG